MLTALTQLAVGNMENYHACQTLEQKLLDSRAKEARLAEKVRSFEDMGLREQQNFEYVLSPSINCISNSERCLQKSTQSRLVRLVRSCINLFDIYRFEH